jgi:KUP system potassium uptake protein
VILEKFLSVENEFSIKDSWLLNSYFILKRMSVSDTKAFGLDKSDVIVEELPIIYQPTSNITLIRKK